MVQHVVLKKEDEEKEAVEFEVVNLRKMSKTQMQDVVDSALATSEQSNEEFERKFHERVQQYASLFDPLLLNSWHQCPCCHLYLMVHVAHQHCIGSYCSPGLAGQILHASCSCKGHQQERSVSNFAAVPPRGCHFCDMALAQVLHR